MSTCGTLRARGNEILADKLEKSAFSPFLGPLFAHISSHNGIWEKLPPTRFTYSPIPGHMPSFRKIVWLKLWDLVEFCTFRWASNSSRSSRGPTHSSMQKHVEKTRPPSGKRLRGTGHLAYVVEGHASACPRTVGVDASRGVLTLEIGGISSKFK